MFNNRFECTTPCQRGECSLGDECRCQHMDEMLMDLRPSCTEHRGCMCVLVPINNPVDIIKAFVQEDINGTKYSINEESFEAARRALEEEV